LAVCPPHPAFKSDLETNEILYSSCFVEQKDLILDFNLYLCEKFGYRNSCSVMQNANGFCVNISERDLDCHIRFGEYSYGRGNFPEWAGYHHCAQQLQKEPRRKPERFGSVLQGVYATLRLQIPLHRRR